MTVLSKLVAFRNEGNGYLVYVFKCLDPEIYSKTPYIMCVRYPNWQHEDISLGKEGFLTFEEVKAGIDKWYNGSTMIPYNYNNIQFIKFVDLPANVDNNYIM